MAVIEREEVLDAAIDQLAARGYDGVRLRDVASAAGVSIGLIQHRFTTREELLNRALEHHCLQLLDDWQRVTSDQADPWQRLVALVEHLALHPSLRRRAIVWAEICAAAARHETVRLLLQRVQQRWRNLVADSVAEGVRNGAFAPVLPQDDVVEHILHSLDGALLALAAGADLEGRRMGRLVLNAGAQLLGHTPST